MIFRASHRHSWVSRKTKRHIQETTTMILKNKVAVVYGAGGDIGSAVARAFAREGAKVFLSGRSLRKVEAVAADIHGAGGIAEAAEVNALDESAIEAHLSGVAEKAGCIDISFNAVATAKPLPKLPLTELSAEDFALPFTTYTLANFLTARAAARRMVSRRAGVILTITGTPGRMGFLNVGGTSPAYAAIVALTRSLSAELGPQGVRALCLMPNAIPETTLIRDSFVRYAKAAGVTQAEFQARFENMTHVRRLTTLDELARTAVFLASDHASAMTGTVVNLSGGAVVD
jgi:NAD(P)-dependent dehydrogenase (short-subunit alcohol dehydrogenase family)